MTKGFDSLLLRLLLLLKQHLHLLLDVLQVLQQVHVPSVLAGWGLLCRLRGVLLLLLHPQQLQSSLFLLRKFLKTVILSNISFHLQHRHCENGFILGFFQV